MKSRLDSQNYSLQINSADELSYFGLYLKTGHLNFQNMKAKAFFMDTSFQEDIDNFYLINKPKPESKINRRLQRSYREIRKELRR